MIPRTTDEHASDILAAEGPHVLIVTKEARHGYQVAHHLLEAGYRVTTAATFGVVEILLEHSAEFDLLITEQSFDEMGQFGLPQLARSVRPSLPILVAEAEAFWGDGVVEAAGDAIRRWPLRERSHPSLH